MFRGYYDSKILLNNVTTIPIGFKSGFLNKNNFVSTIFDKEHIWAFIGQLKNDRQQMYNVLNSINPNFTYLTHTWNCPTSLSVEQIIEIYKKTIFIPCPIGWINPDSFRINEALEWGCIPIVKKYNNKDYFKNVYGNHPFILVDDWDVAYNIIIELCQNFEKLEQYRLEIAEWYSIFKLELQNKIKSIIND